jgi:hypothetical protein
MSAAVDPQRLSEGVLGRAAGPLREVGGLMSYKEHAGQAMDSLSRGEAARRSETAANEIASAQVHATLALAEAMR